MKEEDISSENELVELISLEKEEITPFPLSYGEVFIVEIDEGCAFKWWINCKICKEKFDSFETFLDHAISTHLSEQIDEIPKMESEDLYDDNEDNITITIRGENDGYIFEEKASEKSFSIYSENNKSENDGSSVLSEKLSDNMTVISHISDITKSEVDESSMVTKSENDHKEVIENKNLEIDVKVKPLSDLDSQYLKEKLGTYEKVNGRHPCPCCGKTYATRKILMQHAASHFEKHPCPDCDKIFTSKRNLKLHTVTHFQLKQLFKCEKCGACLHSKRTLKNHMRIHTGERPVKCNICSKRFRTRNAFTMHLTTHTGEKKYSCSFCGKDFRTNMGRQIHERGHTGEKPFQCDKCGSNFQSPSALATHIKRHEKAYIEKTFKCESCAASFGSKKNLKVHEKIHIHARSKDFNCSICDTNFLTYGGITYHMKKKHGCAPVVRENYSILGPGDEKSNDSDVVYARERTVKCELCPSTFGSIKSLRQHDRVHAKSKDYNCYLCSENFQTYHCIQYHMSKVHGCSPMANRNYSLLGRKSKK